MQEAFGLSKFRIRLIEFAGLCGIPGGAEGGGRSGLCFLRV